MQTGIYRNRRYPDMRYLTVGLAQQPDGSDHVVIYVPLFLGSQWSGKARLMYRTVPDFADEYEWESEAGPQ